MTVTDIIILLEDGSDSLLESGEQGPARDVVWTVRLAPPKWSCVLSTKWAARAPDTKWETGVPRS